MTDWIGDRCKEIWFGILAVAVAGTASIQPQQPTTNNLVEENDKNGVIIVDPMAIQAETAPSIHQLFFDQLQNEDADQVKNGLRTLNNRMAGDARNCLTAFQLGGHALIYTALNKWQGNSNIEYLCFICLQNFLFHLIDTAADIQTCLLEMNLVGAIITALKQGLEAKPCHVWAGLKTLDMLFVGPDATKLKQKAASKIIKEMDGTDLVLSIMKAFPDEVDIQCKGCAILTHLARLSPPNVKTTMLEESGAMQVVMDAMTKSPKNTKLKHEVSRFIVYILS